jgi:hypothetical protein
LVLAGIILLPAFALGSPAEDAFAYAVGPLPGNNGGSGWGGSWSGADIDVVGSSLSHPSGGLITTGGAAQLNPTSPFASAQAVRNLSSSLGDSDETIWVSFLIKPLDLGAVSYFGITIGSAGDPVLPDPTRLFVGYYGTNYNMNSWGHLTDNVDVPGVVSGQTTFLVLALDIFVSGNETATLYVNPTPGLAAPDVAGSTPKSDLDLGTFNTLTVSGGRGLGTNHSQLDEIRVGSTYAEVAPVPVISGTVFEDINYGGGAGRNLAASGGVVRSGATVELYDASAAFVDSMTTNGAGQYLFTVSNGSYTVRVVNATVTSSRTGYVAGLLPVQTYRANASSGSAVAVTSKIGGEIPHEVDAPVNSTNATLAALNAVAGQEVQSPAPVTVSGASVTGVDFGFNFSTIVNTNDSDQGSLRQFIDNANALGNGGLAQSGLTVGIESSIFEIPTTDPQYQASPLAFTISLDSVLPTITDPVRIDGSTQAEFTTAGRLVIELSGANYSGNGLILSADGSTVRGLVINRFNIGLWLYLSDGAHVAGNYIGPDVSGDLGGVANLTHGIVIQSSRNTIIGGTSAADRNVISGNDQYGILIDDFWEGAAVTADSQQIIGNFIGTNASGTDRLPTGTAGNYQTGGVWVNNSPNNRIGGTGLNEGNVISGNRSVGVYISGTEATGNLVRGNIIGLEASGTNSVPNGTAGSVGGVVVWIGTGNRIGGIEANAPNIISGNDARGVVILGSTVLCSVVRNSIYGNTNIGIDLDFNGVTGNDDDDHDVGSNDLLNFPVLTSANVSSGSVTVDFDLDVYPAAWYRIEFFKNPSGVDPSGNGEGETFTDSVNVSHAGAGVESFSHSFSGVDGDVITATATRCTDGPTCSTFGPTSEFSAPYTATDVPYGDVTSQGISFPGVTLNGQDQLQAGSTTAWTVTSTYPAGTGWHITIEGNDFSNGSHSMPIGNLEGRLLDANIVVISGSGPPSSTMTSYAAMSASAQTMLQATGANGVGDYEFTPEFRLSIPAEAYIGTYTASVTATFIVGP